jgi:hypothetical protein
MNLRVSTNKKTGRSYLTIVRGYRDKDTGKARATTVQSLGYLDDLQKQFPDPVAHFREVARLMTESENESRKVSLSFDLAEELALDSDDTKNLGYAAILKLFHDLDLPRFLNNKARRRGFQFSSSSVMALLVISRILSPGSKKKAFEDKGRYFERFDFSLVDVYRCLSHFAAISKELQRHLNERIRALHGRDTRVVYYDVTNFFFEIDAEDDLRKRGVSKEKRKDPIVQMGLAMDADGIPLHYELFPGNTPDKSTFRSVIGEVRRAYDTGRVIVVADMGIITGDNIFYLVGGEKREKALNGYVFSFSIRGGTKTFQKYVLDLSDYLDPSGEPPGEHTESMRKSRPIAREISVTMDDGSKKKMTVYEKQVVFWSRKYAERARQDREKILAKAASLIQNPAAYTNATSYGAAKYVRNLKFDPKTGEVLTSASELYLDEEKIAQDAMFDGYYAIVTSETEMSDDEVVETYRGLWEIEETFRVTKGTLEARPVHLSREDRIEAHFLICFISLVIMRLLQKQTGKRFSCDVLIDCLNRISCTLEQDNIYLFGYRSKVADVIGTALGIDFAKKRMRLQDIKGLLAGAKRQSEEA